MKSISFHVSEETLSLVSRKQLPAFRLTQEDSPPYICLPRLWAAAQVIGLSCQPNALEQSNSKQSVLFEATGYFVPFSPKVLCHLGCDSDISAVLGNLCGYPHELPRSEHFLWLADKDPGGESIYWEIARLFSVVLGYFSQMLSSFQ